MLPCHILMLIAVIRVLGVFRPRPKDRSNSVTWYEKQWVLRTFSNPDPHGKKVRHIPLPVICYLAFTFKCDVNDVVIFDNISSM